MIRRANAIGQVARPETSPHATRVWGDTFHSVANRLLRIYCKTIGLEENFTVLDQGDAGDLKKAPRPNRVENGKRNGAVTHHYLLTSPFSIAWAISVAVLLASSLPVR